MQSKILKNKIKVVLQNFIATSRKLKFVSCLDSQHRRRVGRLRGVNKDLSGRNDNRDEEINYLAKQERLLRGKFPSCCCNLTCGFHDLRGPKGMQEKHCTGI